jgi:hypothetical protein
MSEQLVRMCFMRQEKHLGKLQPDVKHRFDGPHVWLAEMLFQHHNGVQKDTARKRDLSEVRPACIQYYSVWSFDKHLRNSFVDICGEQQQGFLQGLTTWQYIWLRMCSLIL